MKRKAEPASVEDLHQETDDVIPGTRRSASLANRAPQRRFSKRLKATDLSRTKRASSTLIARSINYGPIEQVIKNYWGSQPLTILSGSKDHSVERNEVKGCHVRKLFYEGTVCFSPAMIGANRLVLSVCASHQSC